MATGANIAEVAALVGDPGRANMLAALLDGRALTATALAEQAGVTPATASGHLARLTEGHLVTPTAQGRHRYYRLASPEVARMLESILVVAAELLPSLPRAMPRIDPGLRQARTCYDHLAGRLGVALAEALVARGAVVLGAEAGEVTASGRALLDAFGVTAEPSRRTRRVYCRPCMDWSEQRPHLAGVLGAALHRRFLDLAWIRRAPTGRAVTITPLGRAGLHQTFGIDL